MSQIRLKLSVMMFLEYFIWGLVRDDGDLPAADAEVLRTTKRAAYSTTALAAMVSPFFVGLVADRFFATERILAFLHLLGAALLFYVSTLTDFVPFYITLVGYTLCFMPTLALSNSLSFHQMRSRRRIPARPALGHIRVDRGRLCRQLSRRRPRGDAVPYRRQSPRWRSVSSR